MPMLENTGVNVVTMSTVGVALCVCVEKSKKESSAETTKLL